MLRLSIFAILGSLLVVSSAGGRTNAPTLQLGVLLDPGRALTIDDARRSTFDALAEPRPNLGHSDAAIWLRVVADDLEDSRWLLEIAYAPLDRVQAWFVTPSGVVGPEAAGDMLPFVERVFPHRHLVFPAPIRAGRLEAYVRVASEGSLILPVRLWRQPDLLRGDGAALLGLGLYFGLIAALVAYNGFLFASVRDPAYLWYVLYLAPFGLLQLTLSGLAQQSFWPTAAGVSNLAVIASLGVAATAGLLFARSFLRTDRTAPRLDLLFKLLAAATAAGTLAYGLLGYSTAIRLLIVLGLSQIPLIVVSGVVAWRGGFRPARFLLLAYAALAPTALAYGLRALGALGSNALTDHVLEIGTALEAVLLSFALADRINALTLDKQRAEAAAQRARERYAERLLAQQEAERSRVAKELHDSLGQKLAAIRMRLQQALGGSQVDAARLAEAAAIAGDGVAEVRAIAHNLHPHRLESLGLPAALDGMLDEAFAGSAVRCERRIELGDEETPPGARIHLYRAAQEAVSNVLAHSGARACRVELVREAGAAVLRVADDGRGLPPGADSFGLSGLHERARLVGGRLLVRSTPGAGTSVELRLPEGEPR